MVKVIEAIRSIGDRRVAGRGLELEELVEPLEQGKYGVALRLYLDGRPMDVEVRQSGPDLARDWLWVGNAPGTTPQDRLTTSNLAYLICQVVPNLVERLPAGSAQEALKAVKEQLCIDLRRYVRRRVDQRYSWVWDLLQLGVPPDTALEGLHKQEQEKARRVCAAHGVGWLSRPFWEAYAQEEGGEGAVHLAVALLLGHIQRCAGIRPRDTEVYTLAVDGQLLAQDPGYRQYLVDYFVAGAFQEAGLGTCHLCGAQGDVTWDMKKFDLLKFYNNDKKGFATELDPRHGWFRSYSLCKDCYIRLLAGERFVRHRLQTTLGRKTVFVIPAFHLPELLQGDLLEGWARYLKARLSASRTVEAWREFAEKVEQYQEFEAAESGYVLHLLFADLKNSAVKVNQLIADVPPSRLKHLADVAWEVTRTANRMLGGPRPETWWLGWDQLFYLFPIRQVRNQAMAGPYLAFLHALISGRTLPASQLIAQFLETAAIYHFERFGAYVHERPHHPDLHVRMAETVLRSNLALVYLRRLGQLSGLEGGARMEAPQNIRLPEGVAAYFAEVGLDTPRQALFLLGYLLGEVAWVQGRWQSKPVLNKVQFQGVDRDKVVRLSNEVFEKLRQYRITGREAEATYAAMKALLDRSLDRLGPPHENVYWLLSGYSFVTWQRIRRVREGQAGHRSGEMAEEKTDAALLAAQEEE